MSYGVQCAAVSTHCAAMIAPPQWCFELYRRETCHGIISIVVSVPPKMRLLNEKPLGIVVFSNSVLLSSSRSFSLKLASVVDDIKWFPLLCGTRKHNVTVKTLRNTINNFESIFLIGKFTLKNRKKMKFYWKHNFMLLKFHYCCTINRSIHTDSNHFTMFSFILIRINWLCFFVYF